MLTPGKFRHKALQKMSSPDQLDRLLKITLPRRWVGLTGLLLVVAAVVVWSAIASVPTTLNGPGFLLPQGGLREVQAPSSGTVRALSVGIGDHVVAQQTIGSVVGPDGKNVEVKSPETGVVTEADSVKGAYVNGGDRLALVQPVGFPLVEYAYVSTTSPPASGPGRRFTSSSAPASALASATPPAPSNRSASSRPPPSASTSSCRIRRRSTRSASSARPTKS